MIRIRLCQKLPLKFNRVRAQSSVAYSALSANSLSSAPSNTQSSPTSHLVCNRHKRDAAAQQPTSEPCTKPHSFDNDFFPQSITPYRFDSIPPNRDLQTGTTRIQVLEQWKQLLESLNAIVEGFSCARTAVQDVSAIRLALERHHLVKLLVKPYSYTADDVFSSTSRRSPYDFPHPQDVDIGSFEREKEGDDNNDSVVKSVNVVCSDARSSNELSEFRRRSCINQLEHESLRAVMVLTSGAWKNGVSYEGIDSTLARNAADRWNEISPVMLCQVAENGASGKEPMGSKGQGRPNRDQLNAVQDYMADNLPKILVKFHSYDIYTNDVVFENNWYLDKSYVTVGTLSYALEIAKLRLFVHLRYANVKMQLLKATTEEADGTVRIRWRISGIPQAKAIMFWKFLPWASRSSVAENFEWLDGFSTFFVNNNGLIYKHRMDRVIQDEGPDVKKSQTVIEKIATTIATPPATNLG